MQRKELTKDMHHDFKLKKTFLSMVRQKISKGLINNIVYAALDHTDCGSKRPFVREYASENNKIGF